MRPQTVTQTGTGSSGWLVVDHHKDPFNIGMGVVVTGTANYTVEHTFDNVMDSTVVPVAFDHADLSDLDASADGNYAFPVRAVRITVNSGSGSARLTLIQAGL